MKIFSTRNLPIRRKLTFIILGTCTAALLVACVILFALQVYTFWQGFTRDLSALAEIVAANSTAAVTFDDEDAAQEILAALHAKKHIVSATIVRPNGKALAQFGTPTKTEDLAQFPAANGFLFARGELLQTQAIMLNGKKIGWLYLRSDCGTVFAELLKLDAGILAAVLAISFLIAFAISSRLKLMISEPIQKLAESAKLIAEKNDYTVRAEKLGQDEIGSFTDAFNRMLEEIQGQDAALQAVQITLEQQVQELQREITERERAEQEVATLNRQLLESSRQAGMAEVATGVLHNVGNVLNSVNVSTTLIADQLRKSKAQNVARAAQLLRERNGDLADWLTNDEKGKLLPSYLAELGEHLNREQTHIVAEIELLAKNIEHIKEIVAMQQNYARVSGLIESLPIDELVEDALQMNAAAFARHHIKLVRDFEPVPLVAMDKHKVLQILINLIRNAKYAMDDCASRVLTVGIGLNGANCVKITVADTGIGISPENLTRIFSHGFTTKKEGHGFGLHSGAIAAKEMGGILKAHSDGPGRGATFTLELPIAKNSNA